MGQTTTFKIPDITPELARGTKWLKEKRAESSDRFNRTPLPPRGLHLWRYTDPSRFLFEQIGAPGTSFGNNYATVEKIEQGHLARGKLAGLVTDLGGRTITTYGLDALTRKGVIVMPLAEAVESKRDLVEKYFYQLINGSMGKFEAMNGALWSDGIFIYVPDGMIVDKPIHLLRESSLGGSVQFPRLLAIVGERAELTLIDEYGGGSTSEAEGISHTNSAVEIFGLAESQVRYVSIQRQAPMMRSYLTHRARIERGATMLTIPLAFGASLS
ncbi:MAG TPA: SufD family Fe-S cluster assembly protein, partial [Candidatus Acidoferrum sp.]|nr:SufD family Fe-S cluster assembly protein [Candidatus Acidoferrum sp.]